MQIVGIISADIIGSTSIDTLIKVKMMEKIKKILKENDKKNNTYTQITGGDKFEIIVFDISQTMRIALILKALVKGLSKLALEIEYDTKKHESKREMELLHIRHKYFRNFGVRMAIEIDKIDKIDKKKGIIEGQAIYNAGRRINSEFTHSKERIVIKSTISFGSYNKKWEDEFQVVFTLIDFIFSKMTSRQCEIIVEKLSRKKDEEIKNLLNITQPAVNQIANTAGWREINAAINRFEKTVCL